VDLSGNSAVRAVHATVPAGAGPVIRAR
jgi:hypothetical protein